MPAISTPHCGSALRTAAVFALACGGGLFPSAATAQPGYHCRLERQGEYGEITAEFEAPRNGKSTDTRAFLNWENVIGGSAGPRISAGFYRTAEGHYRIENGFVSIGWHVWDPRGRPLTLSLQLRSRPEAPPYGPAAFASAFERSGGPFSLKADWSDIAALARGASELHLVAVDKERKLVATAPLDKTIFERVEPHIISAMGDLEAIILNPASACEYLDDLRSNDIVVTSGPQ